VANLLDHYEEWGEEVLRIGAAERSPAIAEIAQRGRELHYEWVEHAFGQWLAHLKGRARSRRRATLIAICDVTHGGFSLMIWASAGARSEPL